MNNKLKKTQVRCLCRKSYHNKMFCVNDLCRKNKQMFADAIVLTVVQLKFYLNSFSLASSIIGND